MIKKAISSNKLLFITYESRSSERTNRTIIPISIAEKKSVNQLEAYCTLREAERSFNLSSIHYMALVDEQDNLCHVNTYFSKHSQSIVNVTVDKDLCSTDNVNNPYLLKLFKERHGNANNGDAWAEFLGEMLLYGLGCEINISEGLKLIHSAAEKNNPGALWVLSEIHQYGKFGCPSDIKLASVFYEMARNAGNLACLP